MRGQIGVADGIMLISVMLAAVGFDDQPMFEADEIGDVAIVDDRLTPPPETL